MRTPRPIVVDTLMALVMVCVAVRLGRESVARGWPELDTRAYVLLALAHVPLALRRRAPLAVFAAVQCAGVAFVSLGYWPLLSVFGSALVLYTVASMCTARIAIGCAAVSTAKWVYGGVVSDSRSAGLAVTEALLCCAVLVWFGMLARRSRELARQLRLEQAERARREVAAERGRIARELHDVVAHHMSVISVQAGLARFVLDSDTATARGALSTIEDTSTEALEELRRMLHVLRENDLGGSDSAAPMPTLARLDDLVERVRAAGVLVELSVEGTVRPLPPGVELCAYRVVQEALTNVLKHTRNADAQVRLHYRQHHLTVSVTNDGEEVISDNVPTGTGHGLIGMRERTKLYGGTISVGPRAEGGFAVSLTLPTSTTGARWGEERTR
ncbi:sensor histidine kinase [Streptomyces sp. NBC_00878]|uniref:sensor histidine kinase n=1 Tax=Streptomyces sp. NBC_00878 TaxID=2975854 RepID=UPI002251DC22|nr:sensor histidine kinase [Streptomyces sp. NBC_00878]MCX4909092.1 sensor histidine kinase [Streptomyces sp. NBC_00878]